MGFSKPLTFFFFGRSGAGKGTQVDKLKNYLEENDTTRKVLLVQTGELMRALIRQEDSYVSKKVEEVHQNGLLLPSFVPVWLLSNFLGDNLTGEEHLIFDGVCRQEPEAPIMAEMMEFFDRSEPHIIYINSSRQWCKDRLLDRARSDDTPKEIDNRLDWYESNVVPTLESLRTYPVFEYHSINGEQSIEEVHREILTELGLDSR